MPIAGLLAERTEIHSLTVLRGLASIWVVGVHFATLLYQTLPELLFLKPLVSAGVMAVPLFFVLSGYVLGLRYLSTFVSFNWKEAKRFWWLRLGRIYPLHLCTLLAILGLVARRGWPTDEGHSVASFVANVFLVHSWQRDLTLTWNYPAWSISSEWFAYLLFPFLAVAFARLDRSRAIIAVVIAALASAYLYVLDVTLPFRGLFEVLPTFWGGVALSLVCGHRARAGSERVAAVCGISALALPFLVGAGTLQRPLYMALFFVLVGSLGLAGDRAGRVWNLKGLIFLGDISYSLYMTHVIVISLLARFVPFSDIAAAGPAMRVGAVLGCLLAIGVVAICVHYAIEQPLRNASRAVARAS